LQPFPRSSIVWFVALFVISTQSALALQEACPGKQNAHVVKRSVITQPDGTTRTTTDCECDQGYERSGGRCTRVTIIGPRPEPIIRPLTRAECERNAGTQFETDLGTCEGPVISCLKKEGVPAAIIKCVGTVFPLAVFFAGSAIADPTKTTTVGSGASLIVALAECQDNARSIAQMCGPTAADCEDASLKAHTIAMAACPK
jgi:hypothetical protein